MKTLKQARTVGTVSKANSKMPGTSFAISARRCNVGSKLYEVQGSVCQKCYALRIQNFRKNVDKAWEKNYNLAISSDPEAWITGIAYQLQRSGETYHRWFDSGDLQSEGMLDNIVEICKRTPEIKHWLPTREVKVVFNYKKEIPENLVVRVSSPMVDDKPLNFDNTSTVHSKTGTPVGHICPASQQGNKCGDCRACWSKGVKNVSYPLH